MASPDHQVGAHFEALDEGALVAPSKSIGYFLPFQVTLKYGDFYPLSTRSGDMLNPYHEIFHGTILPHSAWHDRKYLHLCISKPRLRLFRSLKLSFSLEKTQIL